MTIAKIKQRIRDFRDFYGGDLICMDEVEAAKTKQELAAALEKHRSFMEDMLSDAHTHLDNFKSEVGLRYC